MSKQEWLDTHPHRTSEWLDWVMTKGFMIVEGYLVETEDAKRLRAEISAGEVKSGNKLDMKSSIGKSAYELRLMEKWEWDRIGRMMCDTKNPGQSALKCAKNYAKNNGLAWPLNV